MLRSCSSSSICKVLETICCQLHYHRAELSSSQNIKNDNYFPILKSFLDDHESHIIPKLCISHQIPKFGASTTHSWHINWHQVYLPRPVSCTEWKQTLQGGKQSVQFCSSFCHSWQGSTNNQLTIYWQNTQKWLKWQLKLTTGTFTDYCHLPRFIQRCW